MSLRTYHSSLENSTSYSRQVKHHSSVYLPRTEKEKNNNTTAEGI